MQFEVADAEAEYWPLFAVLRHSSYQFTVLNNVPGDSIHKCTVFGCYQRRWKVYRFANSSCSLPGKNARVGQGE